MAIKVLIVDDSALIRQVLADLLNGDPELIVVGAAGDPYAAREKIKQLKPDVLTLDVEMPRMDGITFLRNLMRLHPMPVVMVSSLTERGAEVTLQALELGAVDFVAKPKLDIANGLETYADEIRAKVKTAARVERHRLSAANAVRLEAMPRLSADVILPAAARGRHFRTTDKVIAIGASTGGTEAIREVLAVLPPDAPPIVIAQHIPAAFSGPFAERMDRCSQMSVREARDGDLLVPGHVFIAPGDKHLLLARDGARYICRLNDGPPVNRHRPSVDVLFRSVAANAGPNAVGVILTGMGGDGAAGMREMHEAGAATIAQDEKSSVVWGMPGEAVKAGGVDHVLPLGRVAEKILSLAAHQAATG